MADSKSLFLRNKDDVKAALAITTTDIFYKMIAYARAEFSQSNPSSEESNGANKFISILMSLPEEEPVIPENLTSGLEHDLSIPDRSEPKTEQPK